MFSSNFTNRFLIISHGFGVDYWLGKTGPVNVDVFCFCFFSKQGLQRSQASVSLTPLLEDLPKILCDKCFHWFGINHPLPVSFSCQQIVAEAKVSIFTIVFIFLLATPGFMMIVCLPDCYSRSHGPVAEITLVNNVMRLHLKQWRGSTGPRLQFK